MYQAKGPLMSHQKCLGSPPSGKESNTVLRGCPVVTVGNRMSLGSDPADQANSWFQHTAFLT